MAGKAQPGARRPIRPPVAGRRGRRCHATCWWWRPPTVIEVDRIPAPKPLTPGAGSVAGGAATGGAPARSLRSSRTGISRSLRSAGSAPTLGYGGFTQARPAIRAHEIHYATTGAGYATRRSLWSSSWLSRTWAAVVDGANADSTARLADAALGRIRTPARLQDQLVWHQLGDRATVLSFHSTVFTLRSEDQTPPDAIASYRLLQRMPPDWIRDLNAAINLARLGDPTRGGTGTGTGSSPAASVNGWRWTRSHPEDQPRHHRGGVGRRR